MRDRLIELLRQIEFDYSEECVCAFEDGYKGAPDFAKFFVDHLLAGGVIVPPCKVGDTVWYIDTNYNIQKAEVTSINIRSQSKSLIATRYVWETEETVKLALMFEHLNEDYWLTKEQAEKALAEVANGT